MPDFTLTCPITISDYPQVLMAHGGGGRLMRQLIGRMFAEAFHGETETDSAVLATSGERLAFTTDSFVVRPIFFPGGDIGSMAVHGTVNDLAMSGATPRALSCALILEEGLPMETLWRVIQSMSRAAIDAGVKIVTGDTKVVERGKADGLYINTAGVGFFTHDLDVGPRSIEPGDAILVSGDIARHGMAIMATREGLEFDSAIESDSAAVHRPVLDLFDAGLDVHCLRDLTRGGLASALVELADSSGREFRVGESRVAVREDVRAACEILGFDPFYVANEGRFVAFLPEAEAAKALSILARWPVSAGAAVVGRVSGEGGRVLVESPIGGSRLLDLLSGEQLPRIC
jgi:hydrogenase expression/formation protein HypE